jgi:cell division protein FtsN/uncharacterized membrane protein YhaH (DUF805 family)
MLKSILINAFSFRGQNSRPVHILYGNLLPILLLLLTTLMMLPYIEAQSELMLGTKQIEQILLGMIAFVPFVLSMAWVSLVQMIKRMRDLGHSGWWILLVFVLSPLPYIGIAINLCFFACLLLYPGESKENPRFAEWAWVVGGLLLVIAVIAFETLRLQENKKALAGSPTVVQSQPAESTEAKADTPPSAAAKPASQLNPLNDSVTTTPAPKTNMQPKMVAQSSNWNRKSYIELKNRFIDMGLCNACADNLAHHVRAQKESECSNLAIRALNGDQSAIVVLTEDNPSFCVRIEPVAGATAPKVAAAKPASADFLGDFANPKTSAGYIAGSTAGLVDQFIYLVQAGTFRTPEDAEVQRVKLSLLSMDAKVTEREQQGRTEFRVRIGPYNNKDDADRTRDKLDGFGFETALVRVRR